MNSVIRNLSLALVLTSSAAWAADAAAGKTVYAARCKGCHGAEGTPSAGMAKAMGIKPMSDPSVQGKSDAELKTAVLKGAGKMKPVAVSDGDADNVVAALRTMK